LVTRVAADSSLAEVTQGAYKLAVQLLGQREDAEDVLQDAATIAASHPSAPKFSTKQFRAWFFRVVRNKAIDRIRQRTRQKLDELDESSLHSPAGQDPDARLEQDRLGQQLRSALDELPIDRREIVLLKDYHGFAYGEIAEIMDIPIGSVMSKLHRARLALRELLKDQLPSTAAQVEEATP